VFGVLLYLQWLEAVVLRLIAKIPFLPLEQNSFFSFDDLAASTQLRRRHSNFCAFTIYTLTIVSELGDGLVGEGKGVT
jgi:hypothetical protein